MTRRAASLALAAILLAPGPAAAQQRRDLAPVAAAAGLQLPERLCAFTRTALTPYGEGLLVHYSGPAGRFQVAVRPASGPVEVDFAEDIRVTGAGLAAVRDLRGPPGADDARGRVWRGPAGAGPPFFDVLIIWQHGRWRMRMRAAALGQAAERGVSEIECAVRAMGRR